MTARTFHTQGIDHVELLVPDRSQAARWYSEKFGFEVIELAGSDWGRPGGPVMTSTDGGRTKLALFEGQPRGNRETAGFHRVAFRISGEEFLKLSSLEALQLFDDQGALVKREDIKDYGSVYSLYCCDPLQAIGLSLSPMTTN